MTLLILLAACQEPTLEVQVPRDTSLDTGESSAPQGPFDSVVLQAADSQILGHTIGALRAGDIDGDGRADIGYVQTNRALAWARGDGRGGLSPQALLPEGLLASRLAQALGTDDVDADALFIQDLHLVDLDGDGTVEWLVTLNVQVGGAQRMLTVALEDPLGRAELRVIGPKDHQAQPVSDLDGDGLPELVLSGVESAVLTSGGQSWPLEGVPSWNYYPQVAALDLNGSGDLDLAVFFNGGFGISEAYLFLNTEAGMEVGQVLGGFYASGALISLASDAEQEALLPGGDGILRMGPDGLVEEIGSETSFFYATSAGDLDDDGDLDLLSFVSGEAVLYASSFEGPLRAMPITGLDLESTQTVIFDLDDDGRADLSGVRWDSVQEEMVLESWLNVSGD